MQRILLLLVMFSCAIPIFAQGVSEVELLRQELTEAREVQAQQQEETARLKAENDDLRKELSEMRRRYADILLASDQLSEKLFATDLAAAQLLRKENADGAKTADAPRMLEILGYCRMRLQELDTAFGAHRETVRAVLEASQASEAIRQQTEKKLDGLEQKLEEVLKPMELGSDKTLAATTGSCAILRLDTTTQIVILDQGSLHGIQNGDEFEFQRENQPVATIRVVALRPAYAAAILTDGDFQALVPGALLHKTR